MVAKYVHDDLPGKAELLLLRAGGEWRVTWPRFSLGGRGYGYWLPQSFEAQAVVPLGRRRLCWVDFTHGVIFSDVLAASPKLCFVAYPKEVVTCVYTSRGLRESSYVCVTARGEVKLVSVSPGPCSDNCRCRCAAITTWTLKTDGVPAWVVEEAIGEESADELWAINMNCGIARVQLVYPLANMNRRLVIADRSAAKSEEEEDERTGGKGEKRGAEFPSSPRRSKRASKRNVRVIGKEWVN